MQIKYDVYKNAIYKSTVIIKCTLSIHFSVLLMVTAVLHSSQQLVSILYSMR